MAQNLKLQKYRKFTILDCFEYRTFSANIPGYDYYYYKHKLTSFAMYASTC